MKHLLPAAVLAVAGTLAAAFAVLWMPTLAGKVITGAALAAVIAWWLGKHRHARRGAEAGLCGAVLATALITLLPAAVPFAVGLVMIAPAAAHELNPRRQRVVRTTRGVRTPAAKAAGGRAGRPGEKPRTARRSSATAPRPAAGTRKPAPARPSPQKPSQRPAMPPEPEEFTRWPYAGPRSSATFLPWAGEGTDPGPAPEPPVKLRRRPDRPSAVHRIVCGDCAAGTCGPGPCRERGCECAAPVHEIAPF